MSLNSYVNLKAAILARMARSDVNDGMLADYVRLTEGDFNLSLKRMRRSIKKTTITIVNGEADLPADFQGVVSFQYQSRPYSLSYVPIEDLSHTSMRALDYSIGDKLYFGSGATAATLDLYYYSMIPPLETNSTNWLLKNYPQVYLDGCLYNGFKDRRNTEEATKYYNLSVDYIQRLKDADQDEQSGQTTNADSYGI